MRTFVLTAVLLTCVVAHAQGIDLQNIVQPFHMDELKLEPLSPARQANLKRLLLHSGSPWQGCEGDNSWTDGLKTSSLSATIPHGMLVEAGAGCARGGQGSNGAMWLVQWRGTTPVLLGHLSGWFYRALSSTSHGLPDVTTGWHISSAEFSLTLYRFDGQSYQKAGGADVTCPDNEYDRCVAKPSH